MKRSAGVRSRARRSGDAVGRAQREARTPGDGRGAAEAHPQGKAGKSAVGSKRSTVKLHGTIKGLSV